jgi:hypothetical protein
MSRLEKLAYLAAILLVSWISEAHSCAVPSPSQKELFKQCVKAQARAQQVACEQLYAALYIPRK